MITNYLNKKKETKEKIDIINLMILSLKIPKKQKNLYIGALNILDIAGLDKLYKELIHFIENIEIKEIEEMHKKNFTVINGMTKKEALEKKQEINSLSFLINNI